MEEVQELIHCKKRKWIPARELDIAWIDDPRYWEWTHMDDCHRTHVAELLEVCWLDIKGFLDVKHLDIKIMCSAYLVFKLREQANGLDRLKTSVRFVKDKKDDGAGVNVNLCSKTGVTLREDGWMEIKLGDFFNVGFGEVEMRLYDTENRWKSGLLVKGMEVRSTF